MDSILIIAHGSAEDLNGNAAEKYAEHMTAALGRKVHYAYKGDVEPTIATVMKEIATEHPDRLVVIPLFFAPGMFSNRIIPSKIGLPSGHMSGRIQLGDGTVEAHVTEAFGIHPGMRKVMENVLNRSAPSSGKTSVLLIGHGSGERGNSNTVEVNAEHVKALGYEVHCCYNEFNHPDVAEGITEATENGCDTLLVIPMFVSSSHHSVVEIPGKLGLAVGQREGVLNVNGRNVRVIYETEIGLAPGIEDVLMDSYRGLAGQ
ncbi:MAG: CbiX/SirB N-terminal domain-containing protein [Thermoplasmata archaeon]|nr:CbiX/SirB N-terminal domain-containing protein [Thermoplasmata archaeon]